VRMDEVETAYWMGKKSASCWEDMDSNERRLVWMDRAKMERWGPGVASSRKTEVMLFIGT